MTDDKMLELLRDILDVITVGDWHGDYIDAIEAAILKLQPTPPLFGSIPVRIAVAISGKGTRYGFSEGDDDDALDEAIEELRGEIPTHFGIATLHIPPRAVPVVSGEVEPFDPEATV